MLDIDDVIAAFSEEQVRRLTGLTKGRLRYWDRTGFFSPSHVAENRRIPFSRFYSFKDVVALRTLEMLRVQNNVPLQHLRKVAEKLAHLGPDMWARTEFYAVDRKVIVVSPGTGLHHEALSGQYLLPIRLRQVVEDTYRDAAAMRERPAESIGRITRARGICHNAPVVAGTRIPVAAIQRLHEDGYSAERIIEEYPDLAPADVRAAIEYRQERAA